MSSPSGRVENRTRSRARWEESDAPATGIWLVRRRLAEAMRRVIERLTTSDAPEDELEAAARRLEDYAEHLSRHPRRSRYEGSAEAVLAGAGEDPSGGGHFDYSPHIGRSNPLAPPIVLRSHEGRVIAEVTYGSAYEGAPGCVHGGCVAAAFDEVLGYAETFTDAPGMTGTLTVVYRSPTPLHTPLRFDAWIDRVEGRKIFCKSTLHAGDRLCAEAEAIFVSLRPGFYDRLMRERNAS
jgi:acyl-coenzyme A thioesterase PaaI-like protein